MVDRAGPVCAPDVLDVPAYAPLVAGVFSRVRAYVGVPLEGDDGRAVRDPVGGQRQPPAAGAGDVHAGRADRRPDAEHDRGARAGGARPLGGRRSCVRARRARPAHRPGQPPGLGHRARARAEPLPPLRLGGGVLVLDLDDLKQVNDAGGHAAGDELIALCAEVLRATSRPGDTVARTGGDEFAVLAVECDAAALRALEAPPAAAARAPPACAPRRAVRPAWPASTSPRRGNARTPRCTRTSGTASADAGLSPLPARQAQATAASSGAAPGRAVVRRRGRPR